MNLERIIAVRTTKTVYRDGDRAIKVFDHETSKADVLNEALNQARVEATGLNIPRVLEVTKVGGCWAIVTEYIQGPTLARRMQENLSDKEKLLEQFVDLQLQVHAQRVPLLTQLRDKMHRKIDQAGLDNTTRYELHTRLAGMPKHDKLCHGDFDPSNIIFSADGTAYILDWAHATQGNASADVARTYLLFYLNGDVDGAWTYLDLFCQKTGTAKPYILRWLPIVAASQSVKGNPYEREFLLSWVDVVDYE